MVDAKRVYLQLGSARLTACCTQLDKETVGRRERRRETRRPMQITVCVVGTVILKMSGN